MATTLPMRHVMPRETSAQESVISRWVAEQSLSSAQHADSAALPRRAPQQSGKGWGSSPQVGAPQQEHQPQSLRWPTGGLPGCSHAAAGRREARVSRRAHGHGGAGSVGGLYHPWDVSSHNHASVGGDTNDLAPRFHVRGRHAPTLGLSSYQYTPTHTTSLHKCGSHGDGLLLSVPASVGPRPTMRERPTMGATLPTLS